MDNVPTKFDEAKNDGFIMGKSNETQSLQPSFPTFIRHHRLSMVIGLAALILLIPTGLLLNILATPKSFLLADASPLPTVSSESLPTEATQPFYEVPVTIPTIKASPVASPTIKSTPSPTPLPIMTITYPTEGQSITLSESQTFCVVDVPGGNTNGLQKRKNINNGGWTSYGPVDTTCFNPNEGSNTFQFGYKNSEGGETTITRNFTFRRLANITLSVSGTMYRDENCNGNQDTGETNISGVNTTAYLFKLPEYSIYVQTNTSGSYALSKSVPETESVNVALNITAPSGYVFNISQPQFSLSKDSSSATFNWPMVPNEDYGQCQ